MSDGDDYWNYEIPESRPTGSRPGSGEMNVIYLGLFLAVTFFLVTLIAVIVVPRLFRYARGFIVTEKRVRKKREKKIEKWLITKTIPKRDTNGSTTSSSEGSSEEDEDAVDVEAPPQDDCNNDDDDDDDIGHECLICMEKFAPGESVSFSIHCNHVFHHDCIAEWLLKHSDCPYCRRTVLPEKKLSRRHRKVLAGEQRQKSNTSNFNLEDGLVVESKPKVQEEKDDGDTASRDSGTGSSP